MTVPHCWNQKPRGYKGRTIQYAYLEGFIFLILAIQNWQWPEGIQYQWYSKEQSQWITSLILVCLFINDLINYTRALGWHLLVIYCKQHTSEIKGHACESVFSDTRLVSGATLRGSTSTWTSLLKCAVITLCVPEPPTHPFKNAKLSAHFKLRRCSPVLQLPQLDQNAVKSNSDQIWQKAGDFLRHTCDSQKRNRNTNGFSIYCQVLQTHISKQYQCPKKKTILDLPLLFTKTTFHSSQRNHKASLPHHCNLHIFLKKKKKS